MAEASFCAHVMPSFAFPELYHVVMKGSDNGPASVFHFGRLVWLKGFPGSAEYE
jgi:hypothetical protein